MNTIDKQTPHFNPDETMVSVYPSVVNPNGNRQTYKDACATFNSPCEMTLSNFLNIGYLFIETIEHVRSIQDKNTRDKIKKTLLPAGTLSATLFTRDSKLELEDKLKKYNPLLVLDFDNLPDIEAAKQTLSSLPYIYYAGLS
ncbi:MAG: hypothetical protein IJ402_04705, partial [Bacteroidales bacterium]|nr:hypothetical protein [Bacteroidales bacterium]